MEIVAAMRRIRVSDNQIFPILELSNYYNSEANDEVDACWQLCLMSHLARSDGRSSLRSIRLCPIIFPAHTHTLICPDLLNANPDSDLMPEVYSPHYFEKSTSLARLSQGQRLQSNNFSLQCEMRWRKRIYYLSVSAEIESNIQFIQSHGSRLCLRWHAMRT